MCFAPTSIPAQSSFEPRQSRRLDMYNHFVAVGKCWLLSKRMKRQAPIDQPSKSNNLSRQSVPATSGLGIASTGFKRFAFSASSIRAAQESRGSLPSSSVPSTGFLHISSTASFSIRSNSSTSSCNADPSARCSAVNSNRCGMRARASSEKAHLAMGTSLQIGIAYRDR